MPRKQGKLAARPAGTAIADTAEKLTTKLDPPMSAGPTEAEASTAAEPREIPRTATEARRESDVPLDPIAEAYAPKQTSIKTSFRSDGSDHQNDQELPQGPGERWANEDHFTNKSGNARIGTHGRGQETGEQSAAKTAEDRR